ncbi:ABC transporter substrate-binding protein [Martelella soudanensis]|uniref:ABC transporter substrate-binding protein n=1 Tax=unclassified Martelella TaxID=2629616 RepID=UPI0015DEC835|nr:MULTISPECIES: ABC transporter substrate-binding protein [unclassified Martelella]
MRVLKNSGNLSRKRRTWFATVALTLGVLGVSALPSAAEISDGVVKIGILNDQAGPLSDLAGPGSVVAAKLAVEDFEAMGGSPLDVEIVTADHQNKADVGVQIARRWYDAEGVDIIADIGNSAVALAVQSLAREQEKLVIYAAVGTTEITGSQCSPTGLAWLHDSYNLVSGPVRKLVSDGQDTWFFIAADYAFGHNMVNESEAILTEAGGTTVGSVFHPLGNADYASFLLQAQSSGAKVVAFANAGSQLVSSMKQWQEFGLDAGGQKPVAELMFLSDAHAMGVETAQGLNTVTAWYWDLNDQTRAFADRFYAANGTMPTAPQAAVYSMVLHYLKAAAAIDSDDTNEVIAQMRATPVDDFYAPGATLREDNKLIHDFYLVQVKTPEEMDKPWAYYNVVETIPASEAYRPLNESDCPFVVKSAQ